MALIGAILEVVGRDREDWETEDDYAVFSTSKGLAAGRRLDDEQRAIALHDASTEESRYRLSLKDALRR